MKLPQGWVQLAPNMNPKRRTMTEGYLNQRMPRGNTVAMNQNYVSKVLNHPDKFTPLVETTDNPVHNEWASKRNGAADFGFMKAFRRRYL